ncbi:MAG: TonB-dependent receptor [Rhizobiales bacterium]|nr:TonB-dependent receptor [Hyphomicrobiales bacterium]
MSSPSTMRALLLGSCSLVFFSSVGGVAHSQTPPAPAAPTTNVPAADQTLPEINVTAPRRDPDAQRKRARVIIHTEPSPSDEQVTANRNRQLDGARSNIVFPAGTAPTTLSRETIQSLPQGTEASLDKVLLRTPGVTQDSAAGGDLHIRNEHANVQYRINGIMLPDGVGAFGQIIDTGIVGNLSLITGALPAQYGLRTAGVVDIQTRNDAFNNSGTASIYGGSRGTITPSFDYGGTAGNTQYFFSGRYFGSDIGLENPTPANRAIHDHTDQGKGFAYVSTTIDETSRLSFIGGTSTSAYQIPNNPGQPPGTSAGGNNFVTYPFDSANLNQRQIENSQFGVLAYQKSINGLDFQLAYFNRYSTVHFTPDLRGDLAFNGVASDVYRRSFINGVQGDAAYRLTDAHTIRAGFQASGERTLVNNTSNLLPVDGFGNTTTDTPYTISDVSAKTGYLFSTYISDEWKITNQLTLNTGLRFDQMYQYVDANQLSPRISLTYKPFEDTTFHAGYARYFTPPQQVLAAPTNLALVSNPPSTQTPAVMQNDPVQPERSHYFDVGVTKKVTSNLELGIDAYYKIARNLLDDGQFGAAYVLTAFNYDRATNMGVEFKGSYVDGGFRAYANLAIAQQKATNVVSNQYLFAPDELAYIASNYIYTDHAQIYSGSAGASYLWKGTRFSADVIFGSGLRAGFANTDVLPWYSQTNLGISHEFFSPGSTKPLTVRFDVVNAFDNIYQIRDGSGIGVFAPQYGPRRGFFAGISQKF